MKLSKMVLFGSSLVLAVCVIAPANAHHHHPHHYFRHFWDDLTYHHSSYPIPATRATHPAYQTGWVNEDGLKPFEGKRFPPPPIIGADDYQEYQEIREYQLQHKNDSYANKPYYRNEEELYFFKEGMVKQEFRAVGYRGNHRGPIGYNLDIDTVNKVRRSYGQPPVSEISHKNAAAQLVGASSIDHR